jgi:hypothetical protein
MEKRTLINMNVAMTQNMFLPIVFTIFEILAQLFIKTNLNYLKRLPIKQLRPRPDMIPGRGPD